MAIVEEIIFNDAEAIKGLANLEDGLGGVERAIKAVNTANEEAADSLKGQVRTRAEAERRWRASLQARAEEQAKLKNSTDEAASAIKQFGKDSESALKGAAKGTTLVVKGFTRLKAAIFSSGIGAVVAIVSTLTSKLLNSEVATKALSFAMVNLGLTAINATSELTNLADVGDLVSDAFDRSNEAIDRLLTTTTKFLLSNPSLSLEEKLKLNAESFERQGIVIQESLRGLDKAREVASNNFLTRTAREIRRIGPFFLSFARSTEDVTEAQRQYDLELKNIKKTKDALILQQTALIIQNDTTVTSLNKVEEATIKVTEAEAKRARLQRQREKDRALKAFEQVADPNIAATIGELDTILLKFETEGEELNAAFIEAMRLNPEKADEIIDANTLAIKGLLLRQAKELAEYRTKVVDAIANSGLFPIPGSTNISGAPIGGFRIPGSDANAGGSSDPDDANKVFDEQKAKQRQLISELDNVIQNTLSGIDEIYQGQIDLQQQELDRIRFRTRVIESELDRELELREQGLANNVGVKEQELKDLLVLEEAAAAKQKELLKKQLDAKLLADSAQALSGVALAAVNFFVQGSTQFTPLAGVALAAAAIGAMFTILSSVKARAASLESLHDGGMVGRPGTNWSSDRVGKGHRVENSNVVLGGDEFVVNGRATAEHRNFLDQLNSGYYNGVDISAGLVSGFRSRHKEHSELSHAREQQMLNMAMTQSMTPLINYMKKTPNIYSYTPGDFIVEVTENQIKKRKT